MNVDDNEAWMPPICPDPGGILHQAVEDARNGRFFVALAKHCWYFDHALEYDRAQYGVRLSFALAYWHDLAMTYPPAMQELRNARDRAAQNVLDGINIFHSFHDARAINSVLEDLSATRELFMQLHQRSDGHAETVYTLAQPVLISFGDYEVCNRYLDATPAIDRIVQHFRLDRNDLGVHDASSRHREYFERQFRDESASVIALLVSGGRIEDAHTVAQRILSEWDDDSVRASIAQALLGEFPPQRTK